MAELSSYEPIILSDHINPNSYNIGGAIVAISPSPNKRLIAVGGRDVFKIINFDIHADEIFTLVKNLRNARSNLNSSTNDVKWHPSNDFKNLVLSAAMNGSIVLWNLDISAQINIDRIFSDHERTVNRLCWHPIDYNNFLSGSQDGNMKLFDMRIRQSCIATYNGKSPVRDVQFNPINTNIFASAYDSGSIQIWDVRKGLVDKTINAHQGLVLGLDWHNDGQLLASCSRDRSIKIWDRNENYKIKNTVQSIASVSKVQWRGPKWKDQVVSACALVDFKVHLWNIHKPYVPLVSFDGHKDVATSFFWVDEGQNLITCSKDGQLILHNIYSSINPYASMRTSSISQAPNGELAFNLDNISRDKSIEERGGDGKFEISIFEKVKIPQLVSSKVKHIPVSESFKHLSSMCSLGFPNMPLFSTSNLIMEGVEHLAFENNNVKMKTVTYLEIPNSENVDNDIYIWPDEDLFVFFARSFWLSGKSIDILCERNAKVAKCANRDDLAFLWNFTLYLFGTKNRNNDNSYLSKPSINKFNSFSNNESFLDHFVKGILPDCSNYNNLNFSEWQKWISLENDDSETPLNNIMDEIVEYFAEIGDVQTCVSLFIVLKDVYTPPKLRYQKCFFFYIEALQKLSLFSLATVIIKNCQDESIRQINQKMTSYYISCSCSNPLASGAFCSKCNLLVRCNVCSQTVSGVFVWCQGCGHGGHLEHLKSWFTNNKQCPAGCLHNCTDMISTDKNGNKNSSLDDLMSTQIDV